MKLLAPNGKPSNLTPEQYRLVRTPAFKAWFGDWENSPETASKVVDSNGEPKVMYHGSISKFTIYDTKRTDSDWRSPFVFITDRKEIAEIFAKQHKTERKQSVKVYELFVNMKNPFDIFNKVEHYNIATKINKKLFNKSEDTWAFLETTEITRAIKKGNFDGIHTTETVTIGKNKNGDYVHELIENIGVFKSNQIKLADGTNTTFDSNNPDIRYNNGGLTMKAPKLLAPNGQPSNLTPEQYRLVRTPAFKAWFGDWENSPETASKVIDEETKEPLVVYHGYMVGGGAGNKFYEFKNLPAFFSKNRDFAEQYASTKSMDAGLDADIYSYACFLNIRKLFDSKDKSIIDLANDKLPEKIRVSHGTMWFLSADMPKEEVLELMNGIITIPTDDMAEDILASNIGDVIAEKVSASQYEDKILLYKDNDWAYITDKKYFNEVVEYEVAEYIYNSYSRPYEKKITYRGKNLAMFILNEETYSYEFNKDTLFLEYLDEVEKIKKYYIDNILYLLDNAKKRLTIEVTNKAGNKKNFYVRKINLKTYKTTTNNNWTMFENDTVQKFLIDNNFGGWIALEKGDKTYAVYDNKNIKLADGTNTTFDSNNPDIRYEIGGIFQGTPHEFDKYSTDYMGTGEGQQVFGWGLYFTDIKDIAKQYAKNELLIEKEIAKKSNDSAHLWIYSNVPSQVKDKLAYLKNELNDLEEKQSQYTKLDLADKIKTYRDLIDIIENYKGKVYSVTLFKGENESDYDLLLWDSPVNVEQLEKIFIEAEKIGGIPLKEGWYFSETKYGITPKLLEAGYSNVNLFDERSSVVRGDRLYSHLAKELGSDKEASLFLLRAGIDGIKYKSGTLSGMEDKEGYNYVIFDDDDVTIENKELYKNGGLTMKKTKAELLAPNGKPSNLAPEQYHLVRTPAFKAWFGDWENLPETASKILDDNGEPLVCYHGSNNDFNEFRSDVGYSHDKGFYGRGFYFTFNTDTKWMSYAKGEAGYYGSKIKDFFIQSYNPFDISELSVYKGVRINYVGAESIVFLSNIAKMFPQLSDKIKVEQKKWNRNTQEYDFIDLPISVLPNLIEEYSKKVKTFITDDNWGNRNKVSGYVKAEIVEYDYTSTGGTKGSYESIDTLDTYDDKLKKEEIEILLICAAIEKYDGIEARYNPEGYMTRLPEITDAIKENHDSILQTKYGDELVAFKPTQIKLADGTNTTFDSNNPDIRYAQGGGLDNDVKVKIIEDDSLAEKVYDIVQDDLSVAVPRLALIENGKVIGGIYLEPAHVLDGKREPLWEYKFDIYIKRSKRKKGYSKILLDAMIKDFVDNFHDADQIRGEVINNRLEKSLIKNYGFHCDSGNQEEITYCYLSREDAIDYLKRGKFSNGGNTKTLLEIINTDGEPNIINDIIDIGGFDEVLSIEQVENKLGREIHWWNDDIVYLSGIKYKKVYLRPEYKKVVE